MSSYRLFVPPKKIAGKKSKDWTKKEAKEYYQWLMSIKDERIAYFLNFIDEALSDNYISDIKRISKKVASCLINKPFISETDNTNLMSNEGYALVADMSLTGCLIIIDSKPNIIKWGIVEKPKSDISYNLPALFGFPQISHIEFMRPSITWAKTIISGENNEVVLEEVFFSAIKLLD